MQATNYPIQPQNNQQQKFLNQILTKKTRKKKITRNCRMWSDIKAVKWSEIIFGRAIVEKYHLLVFCSYLSLLWVVLYGKENNEIKKSLGIH